MKNNNLWNSFFNKKLLTPFGTIILSLLCVIGTVVYTSPVSPNLNNQQLYQEAIKDAMTIEAEEVLPLVTLTKDNDLTTWKDDCVLLLSLHHYPERYIEQTSMNLHSEIWTFTDKEILSWYQKHKDNVTDWSMRLKQLIGVPPEGEYTYVSAFWVNVEDVIRPANDPDVTKSNIGEVLENTISDDYKQWFYGNIIGSYFSGAYPWTRLGYTYDWSKDSGEYGVTEFLVQPNSQVDIEFTKSLDEFIKWMENEL